MINVKTTGSAVQRIRPNRIIAWSAVSVVLMLAVSIELLGLSPGSRWESTGAAIAVLLAGTQALWRLDLRPSFTWNDAGFALVGPLLIHRHSWRDVGSVSFRFNDITITLDHSELSTSLDRIWWIERLFPKARRSYRALEVAIQGSFARGKSSSDIGEPPAVEKLVHRRVVLATSTVVSLVVIIIHAVTA